MALCVPPAFKIGFFEFSAIPCDLRLGRDIFHSLLLSVARRLKSVNVISILYILHILPALNVLIGENPIIFLNIYSFFHLETLANMTLLCTIMRPHLRDGTLL